MSSCEFCGYILAFAQDGFDDPIKAHEWFHGECSSSSCASQRSPTRNLCPYCQHLRLPHLLLCLLNTGIIVKEFPLGITIPFLPLEKMLQEPCDLCRMVSKGLNEEIERVLSGNIYGGQFASPRAHLLLPYHFGEGPGGKVQPWVTDREASIEIRATDGRSSIPTEILFNKLGSDPSCTSHSRRIYLEQPLATVRTFVSTRLQPTVNWGRIRRMMISCSLGHPSCKEQRTHSLAKGFRVIDVRKRCIKEAGSGCQFVALSYVWGKNPDYTKFTATRSSIHNLMQDGALVESRTPKSIFDAMQACVQLGERFLWADRLCIIQDDEDDKQRQIDSMASIFRSAKFTIAVVDGTVDDGIPGISSSRIGHHDGCTIDNLEVMASLKCPVVATYDSLWSQRGWTLQEGVLPRKILYFTQTQAYFRCGSNYRFEDIRIAAPRQIFHDTLDFRSAESLSNWSGHLQAYRERFLSDPKDVFNAFIGISDELFPCPDRPLYGQPRTEFDQSLLWRLRKGPMFTPCLQPFYWDCPSWSWGYSRNFPEHWLEVTTFRWVETLVRWGFVEPGTQPPTLQFARVCDEPSSKLPGRLKSSSDLDCSGSDPDSSVPKSAEQIRKFGILDTKPEEWIHAIVAIAWRTRCIDTGYPFDPSTEVTFNAMDKDLKRLLGDLETNPQTWLDRLPSPSIHLNDDSPDGELRKLLKPGVLIGNVQSAVFTVVRPAEWGPFRIGEPLHINDRDGRIVGDLGKYYEPLADAEILSSMHEDTTNVELIALSLSCMSGYQLTGFEYQNGSVLEFLSGISYEKQWEKRESWETFRFEPDEYLKILSDRHRDLTFFDSEGNYMPLLPIVNVMAIGWSGPYAHRITTGWILLTSWIKAEREFKTILLE
ncbi:heterokaryon incompatibility protein-domain-containing protein [Phyllosticta capitalensis]|uniref:heterokaryon incompatibility protein-domain-containing protein n=1 Tax=Phyllosticta capitalensis TaxID=121624 RepID=UPI0031321807